MNYLMCDNKVLFNSNYIYIDCKESFSDIIFSNNKVKVKYKKEVDYPDTDYKIMLVSVSTNKELMFLKSMRELEKEMIRRGFNDYNDVCDTIFADITKESKKVKKWMI